MYKYYYNYNYKNIVYKKRLRLVNPLTANRYVIIAVSD